MRALSLGILASIVVAGATVAGERRDASFEATGREYSDPYIWDGWRSDGGYRGHAHYAQTSPYFQRRKWRFYSVYEHKWSVAEDIRSLAHP